MSAPDLVNILWQITQEHQVCNSFTVSTFAFLCVNKVSKTINYMTDNKSPSLQEITIILHLLFGLNSTLSSSFVRAFKIPVRAFYLGNVVLPIKKTNKPKTNLFFALFHEYIHLCMVCRIKHKIFQLETELKFTLVSMSTVIGLTILLVVYITDN